MAITAGYFNGVEYDEEYPARRIRAIIADGVYNGELQVMANNSMTISVNPGRAWCEGYFFECDAPETLRVSTAHGSLARIDAVMLRLDKEQRVFAPVLVAGTPSMSPVAPAPLRTAKTHDLKLAEITVPGGVSSITQANIRDMRLHTTQCGLVHGTVEQIDTTALMAQLESWAEQYRESAGADYDAWIKQYSNALADINAQLSRVESTMQNANNAAEAARLAGDYATQTAEQIAEAAPGLSNHLPATQLYDDFTVTGNVVTAKASAYPLRSLLLHGVIKAGTHTVTLHGANWFDANAPHTLNANYGTMTTVGNAVTVVTKAVAAGFYDVIYSDMLTLIPGATYTLSRLLTLSNTRGENTMRGDIRIGKADGTLIKFLPGETVDGVYSKSTTFRAPEDGKIRLALRIHNTGALAMCADVRITWAEIMLSTTAIPYEPYSAAAYHVTVPVDLPDGESVAVRGVTAHDGVNVITNSADAHMTAVFAAAIPQIKADLEEIKLTGGVDITPSKIGAVPNTRKVNGKPLTDDVALSVSDLSPTKAQGYTPSLCVIGSNGGVETLTGLTYETRTGWYVRYGQLVLWGALLLVTGANASGNYSVAGGELAITLPTTATVHGGETHNLLGGSTVTVGGGGDGEYLATLYAARYLSNAAKFVRRMPDGALQWARWEETRTRDPQQFYAQIQVSGWYFDNK